MPHEINKHGKCGFTIMNKRVKKSKRERCRYFRLSPSGRRGNAVTLCSEGSRFRSCILHTYLWCSTCKRGSGGTTLAQVDCNWEFPIGLRQQHYWKYSIMDLTNSETVVDSPLGLLAMEDFTLLPCFIIINVCWPRFKTARSNEWIIMRSNFFIFFYFYQ